MVHQDNQWLYKCQACEKMFSLKRHLWQCPDCQGLLDLIFQDESGPAWQTDPLKSGLWRYQSMLPVFEDGKIGERYSQQGRLSENIPEASGPPEKSWCNKSQIKTLGEGWTPLHIFSFHDQDIWLKHDYLCPTGSYKDRGAVLMVQNAARLGIQEVVEDSSGNAGCAVAAYCALNQIKCTIYLPESTSPGKIKQVTAYGARIKKIPGSRQATSLAIREAAKSQTYLSHIYDPFFYQGTKTIAYEIFEQTGGQMPKQLVVPAGHGTMLLGLYMGLSHLRAIGKIKALPRLIAVQAENCAPLYHAANKAGLKTGCADSGHSLLSAGQFLETVAEGIAISQPPRLKQMLEAIKETDGQIEVVTEDEIKQALADACEHGLYIEPTSAVVLAAVTRLGKKDKMTGRTICMLSGHGLKASLY